MRRGTEVYVLGVVVTALGAIEYLGLGFLLPLPFSALDVLFLGVAISTASLFFPIRRVFGLVLARRSA